MGLINTNGYIVKGVLIKPAYAKVVSFYFDEREGQTRSSAVFGISTTRENLNSKLVLSTEILDITIDKQADNVFQEIYDQAKNTIFVGWEDDIVIPTEETEE